jgi:hypothetical protein
MPILAILLGIVAIDLAFRGTEEEFAQQIAKDFEGGDFWSWLGAIIIVGVVGYYAPARKVSDLFIALIVISLVLRNGNVFSQFFQDIEHPQAAAPKVPLPQFALNSPSRPSGAGGDLNTAFQAAGTVASLISL